MSYKDMKSPVEIWVPLVADPTIPADMGGGLKPDVPPSVGFSGSTGIVIDRVARVGAVATEYVSIYVEKEHANKDVCPRMVDPKDVSERDKLLVAMVRGGVAEHFNGAKTDAVFDGLVCDTEKRKEDAVFLIEQARVRGLPLAKVAAIVDRLGLHDVDIDAVFQRDK